MARVYVKRWAGAAPGAICVELKPPGPEAYADGSARTEAYLTKNLLIVRVSGMVWDMPETVLVRFPFDEEGDSVVPVVREAYRLTVNLWEKVLQKCREAEEMYMAGDLRMPEAAYRQMCERFEIAERVYAECVKFRREV